MDKGVLVIAFGGVVMAYLFLMMSNPIIGNAITGNVVATEDYVQSISAPAVAPALNPVAGSAAKPSAGGSCGTGGGCGCGGGAARVPTVPVKTLKIEAKNGVQDVYVRALSNGLYDNRQVSVKKGIPVRFHFTADPNAGCGRALIIAEFNVQLASLNGEEQVAEFTPTQAGTYMYRCGMAMWRGNLIVE